MEYDVAIRVIQPEPIFERAFISVRHIYHTESLRQFEMVKRKGSNRKGSNNYNFLCEHSLFMPISIKSII